MGYPRAKLFGLMVLGLAVAALIEPEPRVRAQPAGPSKGIDPAALAARIDELLARQWAATKAEPAPLADDAEFYRRLSLDLAGRIPSVAEARAFLDEDRPDKRRQATERFLNSPAYVNHFINVWRALMLPEAESSFEARALVPSFENWLRKEISANRPYDQMVREILTVAFSSDRRTAVDPAGQSADASPASFYLAKEGKPENLAASTARLFLGIRLECAQCHNHPTAKWKQEQFWSFAAFFAGLQRQGANPNPLAGLREVMDRRELAIPNTETVVQASFLDGREPEWKTRTGARVTLANWVTARDNPYFARAIVNRMWAHFFGVGLVEPVDDLDPENPPSHPELLDELARQFVEADYDLKFLIRAITASKAYQLSSIRTHPSQDDPRLFARMAVKGLTGEQIFDSVAMATGYQEPASRDPRNILVEGNTPRAEFLSRFGGGVDKKTEVQTSILQALSLMNGKLIAGATSVDGSETLAAVADAPFLDTQGRVETLFLATLSRKPRPEESARLVKYVESGGATGDTRQALTDVFWALLNTGEFILNH